MKWSFFSGLALGSQILGSQILGSQILGNQILTNGWFAASAMCNSTLRDWSCKSCLHVPGTEFVSMLDSPKFELHGYVAVNPTHKKIIVAFRGTEGDVGQLMNYAAVQIPSQVSENATTHYGYSVGVQSLLSQATVAVKGLLETEKYRYYTVLITGHSLGGALASLMALPLQQALAIGSSRIQLFTYGQPAVGNPQYAQHYNSQGIRSYRVVNNRDDIPHLIFGLDLDYSHLGQEVWLNGTAFITCKPILPQDPNCTASIPKDSYQPSDHLRLQDIVFGDGAC